MSKIPLGRTSEYPQEYAPDVLFALPRSSERELLVPGGKLPFHGEDLWNAWELTWLDASGKPLIGTATIRVDAASPNLIESKSLKLYLNSFAQTRQSSVADVGRIISADLSAIAGALVEVAITHGPDAGGLGIRSLPGSCIDNVPLDVTATSVDSRLLARLEGDIVSEELHSHLLRSLCPVTAQPDMGSLLIRYHGPRIEPSSLLRYVVSYRQHQGFHEACVEQIFVDIKERCGPEKLTVYARYNRRGGLDINPFRSDFEDRPENLRLWRQ